jgi:hypothetical protein
MKNASADPRKEPSAAEPRNVLGLFIGILGPPLLWLAQFEARFALSTAPAGTRRHHAVVVVGFAALILMGAMLFGAYRGRRRAYASPLDQFAAVPRRIEFMSSLGIMSAILFMLATIAQMIADWFIRPGIV